MAFDIVFGSLATAGNGRKRPGMGAKLTGAVLGHPVFKIGVPDVT